MSTEAILTALSIKQPWAALLMAGVKTIEIRRWPTARLGRVLIHAAGVPDAREQGWQLVTKEIMPLTKLQGGIIGSAELTACKRYADQQAFDLDQLSHRNDPTWFEAAGLYGFVFTEPRILTFRKYPGWFRFFKVKDITELPVLTS